MHAQVPTQVGDLHKVTRAVRAAIRLLSSVQAEVRLEVVVAREALVALAALEGLLASVRPFMVLEHVLVAEGAGADLAGEQLVAGWIGGTG